MKKLTLSLLLLLLFTSCSSIRLRYQAEVAALDGRKGNYEFENSYDTGSMPVLCGVTAIFFGGACWFYVVMPTTGQEDMAKKQAKGKLDEIFGNTTYELASEKITQKGWKDEPMVSEFHPTANQAVKPAVTRTDVADNICTEIRSIEKVLTKEIARPEPDRDLIKRLDTRLTEKKQYAAKHYVECD